MFPNMAQAIQQLKNYLCQKYNIPRDLNDPNEIINRLVISGQIPQARINEVYQTAQRMGYRPHQ